MKLIHEIKIITSILFIGLTSCQNQIQSTNPLIKICNDDTEQCGYINAKGDTIIPIGKYARCFSDTFNDYAVVVNGDMAIVGIDRNEKVLYEVVIYDSGADEPSEGLFRIKIKNKIGYADAISGMIIIPAQFDCAFPFENGLAQVSSNCKTETKGEHSEWISEHWYFIDKTGNKVNK